MAVGTIETEQDLERFIRDTLDRAALSASVSTLTGRSVQQEEEIKSILEEGVGPSGVAGGVLSGEYPNPGFAEDMATQIELAEEGVNRQAAINAHSADTTEVHGIANTKDLALKSETVSQAEIEALLAQLEAEEATRAAADAERVVGPAGAVSGALVAFDGATGKKVKAAGKITASQLEISKLAEISPDLGAITAGSLTGVSFASAASNPRVVITSGGIAGYDTAGTMKFEFDTVSGIARVIGVLSSEDGSEIPTKHLAGAIKETQIEPEAIATPLLAANAVTAAKISVATLSAITANLGTITAGTITGATFRTAATNPKVQMDAEGLRVVNAAGEVPTKITTSGIDLLAPVSESPADDRTIRWLKNGAEARGEIGAFDTVSLAGTVYLDAIVGESEARLRNTVRSGTVGEKEARGLIYNYKAESAKLIYGEWKPEGGVLETGASIFLQLVATARRKVAFGKTKIETGVESTGWSATVNHGLGATPVLVLACNATGTFQMNVATGTYTGTQFTAGVSRFDGAKFKSTEIAWIAIG